MVTIRDQQWEIYFKFFVWNIDSYDVINMEQFKS